MEIRQKNPHYNSSLRSALQRLGTDSRVAKEKPVAQVVREVIRKRVFDTLMENQENIKESFALSLFEPIPEWMFGNSIEARNALQNCGRVHPYTCRNNDCRKATNQAPLRAVEDGWICDQCGYTQTRI